MSLTSTNIADGLVLAFRESMSAICTPVSVVTAWDGVSGHGTTVSAFNSLSLNPPMISVSLDAQSDLLEIIRVTRRLGVNVLGADQARLALGFARKKSDKINLAPWYVEDGLPRIDGCVAWIACEVSDIVHGGDHFVAFCSVTHAEANLRDPLTYHRRVFGTHSVLTEPQEPVESLHVDE